MLSWRTARGFSGLSVAAVLVLGMLMPSTAHAAGTEVTGGTPGQAAAPEPPAVKVAKTKVPATASDDTGKAGADNVVAELPKTSTPKFRMIGVTWSAEGLSYGIKVEVRTRTNGAWSAWTLMDYDGDNGEAGNPGTDPLWIGKADGVAARVTAEVGAPQDVRITTIDPGSDGDPATASTASDTSFDGVARTSTAVDLGDGNPTYTPKPTIITRSQWGAAAGTSCDSPLTGDRTRGAVVHHTAGSNSYAKADSMAIVRATQAYHVKGRGWCDIGYNFLVDKYGQIFEGRRGGVDRAVRAAHSGNLTVNTYTMGISMMGNYDVARPTAELKAAMVKLIGWRLGTNFVKAKGTYSIGGLTLNRIAGHRNVVSTACPGRYGYAWLSETGGLRDRVEAYMSKYSTPIKTRYFSLGSASVGNIYIGEARSSTGSRLDAKLKDLFSKSTSTAARYVSGKIRTEYDRLGSRTGTLGYPKDNPRTATDGVIGQHFDTGSIFYVSGKTKAYSLLGDIAKVYTQLGESTGKLGDPISSTFTVSSGVTRNNFQSGWIISTKSTGKTVAYSSTGTVIGTTSTTSPSTAPATVSQPSVTAGYISARVNWVAVANATSYDLCLVADKTQSTCTRLLTGVTTTTALLSDLKPTAGTDWYVKVRASDDGVRGLWSIYRGFNLKAAPATVSQPSVTAGYISARVNWVAVANATSYDLCLVADKTQSTCTRLLTGVTTTTALLSDLKPTAGTDWYVKVRASDDGVRGLWSIYRGFNLKIATTTDTTATTTAPATVSQPSVSAGYISARVNWVAVANATSYDLCLVADKTQSTCTRLLTGVTTTTALLSDLKPTAGTDWYVKVRASDDGLRGLWSIYRGFNLKAAPATVSQPSVTAGYISARVNWTAVANATSYDLCLVADKTQSTCTRLLTGVTTTTALLSDLKPTAGTDWYVKVRASDDGLRGLWSIYRGFNLKIATTTDAVTVPSTRTIAVTGHGYGHGIGMSQYGAQGAAKQGVGYASILSRYYPGTALGSQTGNIRVLISQDTTDAVDIVGRSGLVFRNVKAGSTMALPTTIYGSAVRRWRIVQLTSDKRQSTLQYKTTGDYQSFRGVRWTGDGQFEGPPSIALIMPSGSSAVYRGAIRSAVPSSGSTSRNTVNILTIERYVRGVIAAEMPSSWLPEALKAQAVAARTYGVRSISSTRYYDICSTTACQVYGGVSRETANTNAAVKATGGKVLRYDGKPAFTQFSSSSGGYTSPGSQPYLKAVSDAWDNWSGNANHTWTKSVSAATIERAYPAIGTLKQLKITSRNGHGDWGGRVSKISLVGSSSTVTISGDQARWAFGLKSNWFRF